MLLNIEIVRCVLSYDPVSGVFTRNCNGRVAGHVDKDGYVRIKIGRRAFYGHRLAWLLVTGQWPEKGLDHRDLDKANNRFGNLRLATQSDNMANIRCHKRNACGLKGVHLHKPSGKWKAQINKHGKIRHLGLYTSPEDAHMAYVEAAKRLHGEFARGM